MSLGRVGDQGQGPKGDHEAVGRLPGSKSKRNAQGALLGWREAVQPSEQRRTELVESCKGQLHLGFHPGDLRNVETVGSLGDKAQQSGLSNPRLAADNQDCAPAIACVLQHSLERLTLGEPTQ